MGQARGLVGSLRECWERCPSEDALGVQVSPGRPLPPGLGGAGAPGDARTVCPAHVGDLQLRGHKVDDSFREEEEIILKCTHQL